MAARVHRKGFKPLPEDGWRSVERDGPWKYYVERCVREGAQVKNTEFGERIIWLNDNGHPHREDGPALEQPTGTKYWMFNGHLHRLDGPAVERADGTKYWMINGYPHRLDGPAIEGSDGTRWFYKNGTWYTDITFTQRVKRIFYE